MPCDSVDWSPIASAGAHSQLAGVVAGLVFAGIVLILQRPGHTRRPAEALTLFIAGFFTFALDSFYFAVVAGERTCARAWTETMVASGLLGFGAVGLFVGVAWLMFSLDRTSSTPFRVTRIIVYVLVFIVVGQLNAASRDYLRDVRPAGQHGWLDMLMTTGPAVVIVVIVAHLSLGDRLRRWNPAGVAIAAYVAVGYVLVCAVAFGLLTVVDVTYWNRGVKPAVYITVTLVSVMLPSTVVFVQLLALPWPEPRPAGRPPEPDPDTTGPRPSTTEANPGTVGTDIDAAGPGVDAPDPRGRTPAPLPPARAAVLGGLALLVLGGAILGARRRERSGRP